MSMKKGKNFQKTLEIIYYRSYDKKDIEKTVN